jgi:ATP-dependent helicase Lhr and Lhr-like helicase
LPRSANRPLDIAAVFDQEMLYDNVESSRAEASILRRMVGNVAVIAGLIERHHRGAKKT